MRAVEALDLARLAGTAAAGIARTSLRTQEAVTEAAYTAVEAGVGPAVRPLRLLHRGAVRGIYGCVTLGLRGAAALAGRLAEDRVTGEGTVAESPRTRPVLGALNALAGDRLAAQGSSLAYQLSLRHQGRPVPLEPTALTTTYGVGERRLAVFVHGLVEDETVWTYQAVRRHGDPAMSLGVTLRREFGHLPLFVRYNSGAPIAANGAALARFLDDLVANWPGGVDELLLVGHSMGGLLIHSALALEVLACRDLVTAVITLGAPTDGAPLERLADTVARTAVDIPPATWLANVLDIRSRGIVDLGAPIGPVGYDGTPRHLAVYGSLAPWSHPVTNRLGDGMVPVPVGVPWYGSAPADGGTVVLPGLGHQGLVNHPRVHEAVTAWLRG
ncbi:MAG: hypothetical protein KDB39_18160 [Austwickia sp.]|nr:hypothetical protein [Austwickia sp.]